MKARLMGIALLTFVVQGCITFPPSQHTDLSHIEAISHGDKTYLNKDEVLAHITENQTRAEIKIRMLEQEIDKLQFQLRNPPEPSYQPATATIYDASRPVWFCTVSAPFTDERFMAKSPIKEEAIFMLKDQCRRAGIESIFCSEAKMECTQQ